MIHEHPDGISERRRGQEGVGSPRRPIDLTIVTTAANEEGNVERFLSECLAAIEGLGIEAEVVFFDDGSTDGTADAVRQFSDEHGRVAIRLIRHSSRRGIAAAIEESSRLARGRLVCFLPADLESSPRADVPALYGAMDDRTDVVVGSRAGRRDGKRFASWIYNSLNRSLFGVHVRDANWIKLVRRERLDGITMRPGWHRFLIPILAHRGCRIKEVTTPWHPRKYGRSKFGMRRIPAAIADLLAVVVFLRFGGSPLRLFLASALGMGLVGGFMAAGSPWLDVGPTWAGRLIPAFAAALLAASVLSVEIGLATELILARSKDDANQRGAAS